MTTPRLSGTELFATLRACLRAHRWLIVALTFGMATVAVAAQLASRQPTARAALALGDPSRDATFASLGVPAPPLATGGDLLSDDVLAVLADDAGESADTLRRRLRVQQDAGPLQATLLAEASTTSRARRLADQWATAVINVNNAALQARIAQAADAVRDQIRTAPTLERRRDLRAQLGRLDVAERGAQPYVRRLGVATTMPHRSPVVPGIAGALLGLVLGVLAAIVRDAVRRRVRTGPGAAAALRLHALPLLPGARATAEQRAHAIRDASIRLALQAAPGTRQTWALLTPDGDGAAASAAGLLLETLRRDGVSVGGLSWNAGTTIAGFENVDGGTPQFEEVLLEHHGRHTVTLVFASGLATRSEALYVDRAADVTTVLLELPADVAGLRAATSALASRAVLWPLVSGDDAEPTPTHPSAGAAEPEAELVGDAQA